MFFFSFSFQSNNRFSIFRDRDEGGLIKLIYLFN